MTVQFISDIVADFIFISPDMQALSAGFCHNWLEPGQGDGCQGDNPKRRTGMYYPSCRGTQPGNRISRWCRNRLDQRRTFKNNDMNKRLITLVSITIFIWVIWVIHPGKHSSFSGSNYWPWGLCPLHAATRNLAVNKGYAQLSEPWSQGIILADRNQFIRGSVQYHCRGIAPVKIVFGKYPEVYPVWGLQSSQFPAKMLRKQVPQNNNQPEVFPDSTPTRPVVWEEAEAGRRSARPAPDNSFKPSEYHLSRCWIFIKHSFIRPGVNPVFSSPVPRSSPECSRSEEVQFPVQGNFPPRKENLFCRM